MTETATRATGQPVRAGTRAPDFTLHSAPDQTVSLHDFRGRPVILAFYPADWSPVCGDQMALYNEVLPEFQGHDAELLGISVDGVWCHGSSVAWDRACGSRSATSRSRSCTPTRSTLRRWRRPRGHRGSSGRCTIGCSNDSSPWTTST